MKCSTRIVCSYVLLKVTDEGAAGTCCLLCLRGGNIIDCGAESRLVLDVECRVLKVCGWVFDEQVRGQLQPNLIYTIYVNCPEWQTGYRCCLAMLEINYGIFGEDEMMLPAVRDDDVES